MSNPSGGNERQPECDQASGSRTQTLEQCQEDNLPTLHLRLNQPKSGGKVKWTADTVDNEFMGKKKSKCCCIYEKPKVFGESSSSEEDEGDGCTPHCKGHKKKCYRKKGSQPHDHNHDHNGYDDHGGGGGSSGGGGGGGADMGHQVCVPGV